MRCGGLWGWTALHFAVDSGNVLAVEALIRFGADVNIRDENNKTPLVMALELRAASRWESTELGKIIEKLEGADLKSK